MGSQNSIRHAIKKFIKKTEPILNWKICKLHVHDHVIMDHHWSSQLDLQ